MYKSIPKLLVLLLFSTTKLLSAQNCVPHENLLKAHFYLQTAQADSVVALLYGTSGYNKRTKQIKNKLLGAAFFKKGRWDDAIVHYQLLNRKKESRKHFWLARCYAEQGNSEKTIAAMELYLKQKQRISPKKLLNDSSLVKVQSTKAWRKFWNNELLPTHEYETDEAAYHLKYKRVNEATKLLENILLRHQSFGRVWYVYAQLEARKGHVDLALKAYEKAFDLVPSSETAAERAKLLLNDGKHKKAATLLQHDLETFPDNVDLYRLMAIAQYNLQRYELSECYAELAAKYTFSSEDELSRTGDMLFATEDYLEALRYYTKCLSIKKRFRYYKARGKTYFRANSYQQALNDLNLAADWNPADGEVVFLQGKIFHAMKKTKKACSLWQKASRLGYHEAVLHYNKYCRN